MLNTTVDIDFVTEYKCYNLYTILSMVFSFLNQFVSNLRPDATRSNAVMFTETALLILARIAKHTHFTDEIFCL